MWTEKKIVALIVASDRRNCNELDDLSRSLSLKLTRENLYAFFNSTFERLNFAWSALIIVYIGILHRKKKKEKNGRMSLCFSSFVITIRYEGIKIGSIKRFGIELYISVRIAISYKKCLIVERQQDYMMIYISHARKQTRSNALGQFGGREVVLIVSMFKWRQISDYQNNNLSFWNSMIVCTVALTHDFTYI